MITLTGGGNDVGFADMLESCAYGSGDTSSTWDKIREGAYGLVPCDYAVPNSQTQQIILRMINEQQDYAELLVSMIKKASPDSEIYIIGYPSFISADIKAACFNSLELDPLERSDIDYYLRDLNYHLERAAEFSGVEYVDTYNSLRGGRMCEGSEYVTGMWDIDIRDEKQRNNLFHPNPAGHKMLVRTIEKNIGIPNNLSEPIRPSGVGDTQYQGVVYRINVVNDDLDSRALVRITIPDFIFRPGSKITIEIHSDLINLGSIVSDKDGGFIGAIKPNAPLPPGFHTLVLTGVSYSGEPVAVIQSLTVGLDEDASLTAEGTPKDTPHAIFAREEAADLGGIVSADNRASIKQNTKNPGEYAGMPRSKFSFPHQGTYEWALILLLIVILFITMLVVRKKSDGDKTE